MSRDIFCSIINPKKSDYRKETCIDKLYELPDHFEPKEKMQYSTQVITDLLVSDAIKNYKTEVLCCKILYTNALVYNEAYNNESIEHDDYTDNEYLCKMYLELTLTKLFSIYDKTYHIINAALKLDIDADNSSELFKQNIRDKIKVLDKKLYKKIKSIFSRITNDSFRKTRDDITHNESDSFVRIKRDFNVSDYMVRFMPDKSIKEIIHGIENLTDIIYEQIKIIEEIIK